MPEHFSHLNLLKESPQRVLLQSNGRNFLFIAAVAAICILSIVSFNIIILLP